MDEAQFSPLTDWFNPPTGAYFVIIEKRSFGKVTILEIEGAIKLGESAEFFSQALDNVLRKERTNVVINFSRINYIDSTGMGELIGYLSKFSGEKRQVVLVNPSGRILRLLEVVRLDKVFKLFPDEDSAVAYAENQLEQ
jgi:anti-sigma B factor antagonist